MADKTPKADRLKELREEQAKARELELSRKDKPAKAKKPKTAP